MMKSLVKVLRSRKHAQDSGTAVHWQTGEDCRDQLTMNVDRLTTTEHSDTESTASEHASIDQSDAVVAEPAISHHEITPSPSHDAAVTASNDLVHGAPDVAPASYVLCDKTAEASLADSTTDLSRSDMFIITCDDDQKNASKLSDILQRFCKSCCDYELTVHPELGLGENQLEHLRSGLKHSTYRFIFIDDGFHEDHLVKFGTDAALMEMIHSQDQSIVPVRAHRDIKIPPLLRMFRSLDVHKLLRGKRLDDISVNSLSDDDIDKALLGNIVRMVSKSVPTVSSVKPQSSPRTSSPHAELLRKHYRYLTDNMDVDGGLLGDLFSAEVINHRELERIRVEKTSYERNEYLIKLLMRKSDRDFAKFVELLGKDQSHIADTLSTSLVSNDQSTSSR